MLEITLLANNQKYRGTYRPHPYFIDQFPETHPVNQAFLTFTSMRDNLSIDQAKQIAAIYAQYVVSPQSQFECIVIGSPGEFVENGEHLGFDIAHAHYYSLILDGLLYDPPAGRPRQPLVVDPLSNLLKVHFRPRLNEHRLFPNLQDALFCLECMMALQAIIPHLYAHPDDIFEVVSMWKM
ncbi:hypothetical protein ANRL4_05580 [Anaerolineae bacterium]|nr:hypothetical protein ANRL4_05580 [Anaerolineae bacterium]